MADNLSTNCYFAGGLGFLVNFTLFSTLFFHEQKVRELKIFLFPIFGIDSLCSLLTAIVHPGYLSDGPFMIIFSHGPLASLFSRTGVELFIDFWTISIVMCSTISAPLFVYQHIHIVRRTVLTLTHYVIITVAYSVLFSPFIVCMLRSRPSFHSDENNQIAYGIVNGSVNSSDAAISYGQLFETNFQVLLGALVGNHTVASLVSMYCGMSVMKFVNRFQQNNLTKKTVRMQKALTYWLSLQISIPFLLGSLPSLVIPINNLFFGHPLRERTLPVGIAHAWLPFTKGLCTLLLLRAVSCPLFRYLAGKFGLIKFSPTVTYSKSMQKTEVEPNGTTN